MDPQSNDDSKLSNLMAPLSLEQEFSQAKAFLKQQSEGSNVNLYDHLSQVLLKILQKQPSNSVEIFENLSAEVKRARFNPDSYETPSSVAKLKEPSVRVERSTDGKNLLKFFKDDKVNSELFMGDIPDIMDLANIFEWAGVSLGREETFMVFAAVKKLVLEQSLKSARFFGKMFGTQKDYLIVESERRDEDNEADVDDPALPEEANPDEADVPKSKIKPPAVIPKESATGVNKYVYWVCNFPGSEWVRLPDATPAHIVTSRNIRKLLSGDLNRPVRSFPSFNGTEAQYLRALIARISAATTISPLGYYKFDDEEDGAENAVRAVVLNTEFEWPTHDALAAAEAWCHHTPYILPQGRTTWVNPNPKSEEENEEEGQKEEEEEAQVEPESGPSMLSIIAEDADLGGDVSAWSIKLASPLSPIRYSPVYLRSNRWPGAFAVGYNDKFANIYVGWGLKELSRPYLPPALPEVQFEYGSESGPGKPEHLVEQNDPTLAEEKIFDNNANPGGADGARGDQEEEEDA